MAKAKTKAKPKAKAKAKAPPRVKPGTLYAHVILDRSGSMAAHARDTVGGYNKYCEGLPGNARISLTIFDTLGCDLIRDNCNPESAKIEDREFCPRGGTPLYDAIGRTVGDMERRAKGFDRVALVISTDGEENSSREFTAKAISELLTNRQEKAGWLVLYLGANQDAWQVGRSIGIAGAYTISTAMQNYGGTISALSANTRTYASGQTAQQGRRDSVVTAQQRSDATKAK